MTVGLFPFVTTPLTLGSVFKYNSNYPTKFVDGDTWNSTTDSLGNIIATANDFLGWQGGQSLNLSINQFSDATTAMTGTMLNSMSAFGAETQDGGDGFSTKTAGIISINGTVIISVMRQTVPATAGVYGRKDSQLVKATTYPYSTWTPQPPSTAAPFASPMFPGTKFANPSFIQYAGADYQGNTVDNSNLYVYALSTDGVWNNGSNMYLGRVLISAIGNLSASDWSYYKSGDGMLDASWDSSIANAIPVLSSAGKLGFAGAQHVPALGKYYMIQWYYPSVVASGTLDPSSTIWTVYEATHPWGPWTLNQTILWPTTGLYSPAIIPKSISGNTMMLAAGGNFSGPTQDPATGEYTLHLIPATVG